MKIAVNHVSRLANNAVHLAGGRCIYDATNNLVIVEFPKDATIQSHGGTSDVHAYIGLNETGEVLRYHRAWSIEESSLVMAHEETGDE